MDFLQKVFYVFKNKYLGLFIEFFVSILVVRYLGTEKYGIYVILFLLPTLISSLGAFGFGPSIVYHINKKKFEIEKYVFTFFSLGILIGFLYYFLLNLLFPFINMQLYDGNLNENLFIISSLFIPIMICQKYIRAIIRGMYKIKIFSFLIDLLAPLLRLTLVIIILLMDFGLEGMVKVPILVQSFITLIMFFYLLKKCNFTTKNIFFNQNDFIDIVKFAFKNYLGSALQKSNDSLLMIIASSILTAESVGLLSLSIKLLGIISAIPNALLTVLMPKVSKSTIIEIENYIPRVTRILFSFNIIVILCYLLILEEFVVFVYGIDYRYISILSIPFSLIPIFLPFANIFLLCVSFTGDPIKKAYSRGIGLAINIIICYPLFLLFDSLGFAISMTIGQLVIFLMSFYFFTKKFKNIKIIKLFLIEKKDIVYLKNFIKKDN